MRLTGTFGFNARNIAFFIKLYFSIFILWPMGGRRFSLSLSKQDASTCREAGGLQALAGF